MHKVHRWWLLTLLFCIFSTRLPAQETDTLKKYEDPPVAVKKAPFFKSKVFKASIVPVVLIGYGVSTINDHGFYSSFDARDDIQKHFPNFDTWLDDAFLIAPYVELAMANLLNQKSNHDFVNTSLLILKAEAIYTVTVFGLKEVIHLERPNGENNHSMPSGHTAQAFLAASILHTELRYRSNWYGVGAYTIATSVGAFRMLKNKHWESDVFVGAGIGILCSHAAYLSHRNRWGRKPFALAPTYIYGTPGVSLSLNFDEFNRKKAPVSLSNNNW
jgi:membrane-associated phospholipid phosphatase